MSDVGNIRVSEVLEELAMLRNHGLDDSEISARSAANHAELCAAAIFLMENPYDDSE
jgi:hypothetical protein